MKKIFLTNLVFLLLSLSEVSFAKQDKDKIKEGDILINEIENLLLFSQKEKEKIGYFNEVNSGDENQVSTENNRFNIQSFQTKKAKVNIATRKKEKIAYNLFSSGQYEASKELYKQILEDEPENDYAKYSLAVIYQKMRQFSEAKKLYMEILKSDSIDRENVIANVLTIISEESPRTAVNFLSRLSSQHPNSGYLMAQTGLIYEKVKQYDKAIIHLKKATQNSPSRLDYRYNLAIIYDKNKNYKEAIESYYDVVKGYSRNKKWQKNIPIKQVRSRIQKLKTMI